MIEFKKNFTGILPYDRHQYINFLFDEPTPSIKWFGVSFQLDNKETKINLTEFIKIYQPWLKEVILRFDQHSSWIVNHDKKDLAWFPNNENNLKSFRDLFKQNNVSNKFKGALIFSKDDLLQFLKDIISYPYAVFDEDGLFYMNIDISHRELPFIIKISDHLNIDLLSTDIILLKEVMEANSSNDFIIKAYRGTTL